MVTFSLLGYLIQLVLPVKGSRSMNSNNSSNSSRVIKPEIVVPEVCHNSNDDLDQNRQP